LRPETVQTGWGIDRRCPVCGALYEEEESEKKTRGITEEELQELREAFGWW
jgi:hypothetical protein